jgi:methionyl-tRNA formyltransferase
MIRIWFFGTPYLAGKVLQDLLSSSDFEIAFVVTNPDKPVGRSGELKSTPVNEIAKKYNIPVFTPIKIRDNEQFLQDIRAFDCDYFIVVAYGRILPVDLLSIPTKKCINVHGSILPKYRWASPIQSALLYGEKETWVTIMEMSEGMDEWDILKIRTIEVVHNETSETLFEKFAQFSWPTLIQTLRELETGWITQLPQDATQATYCKKIEKEHGLIDWSKRAEEIYHMWQAYTPWPGIYTMYEGKRLLLERVSIFYHCESDMQKIGTAVKLETGEIGVICGEWILTLLQVKLEWKKSQSIKDFVNGNQEFIFSIVS